MSLVRAFIVIWIVLSLQACTSPKMGEELEQGKLSFANGDFKQAFHELLPVAVAGNKQAQYAVGYMYYNGYGTPEDTESGIFWMSKSADQGYQPAQNALRMISEKNLQRARMQRSYKGDMIPSVHPTRKEEMRVYRDESIPHAPLSLSPDDSLQPHSPPPFLNSPPPTPLPSPPPVKTSLNTKFSKKDEVMQSLVVVHLPQQPAAVSKAAVIANKPVVAVKTIPAATTIANKNPADHKIAAKPLVMSSSIPAIINNNPLNITPIPAAKITKPEPKPKPIVTTKAKVIKKKSIVTTKAAAHLTNKTNKKTMASSDYTLQVFGSYELTKVKELQARLPTNKIMHTFKTVRNGKPWYVLTYGQFKSASSAKQNLASVPSSIHHLQPWVRSANQLTAIG